jgi:hypothetical protein
MAKPHHCSALWAAERIPRKKGASRMVTNYEVVPVRRTHIALIVVLLVCLIALIGFARGWFSLSEHREAVTHKVDVNLQIDPNKMKRDVRQATDTTKQKASELSNKLKQEADQIKGRAANK